MEFRTLAREGVYFDAENRERPCVIAEMVIREGEPEILGVLDGVTGLPVPPHLAESAIPTEEP